MSMTFDEKKRLLGDIADILGVETGTTEETVAAWLAQAPYSQQEDVIGEGLSGCEKIRLRNYLLEQYGNPKDDAEPTESAVVQWLREVTSGAQQRVITNALTTDEKKKLFEKLAELLGATAQVDVTDLSWEDIAKAVEGKDREYISTDKAYAIIRPLIDHIRDDGSHTSKRAQLMARLIEGSDVRQYGWALQAYQNSSSNARHNLAGAVKATFGPEAADKVRAILNEYEYQKA